MSPVVLTLNPEHRLYHALEFMEERGVRHVPIVEEGALVGIVSDRDLKRNINAAYRTPQEEEADRMNMLRPLREIMTARLLVTQPNEPIAAAARRMVENKVSALPVLQSDGGLEGILTSNDLLRCLVDLLE